jgi:outer membrane lipoprotein-sorting protein
MIPLARILGLVVACLAAAAAGAEPPGLEPAPPGVDARSVAEQVEETWRGTRNYTVATMTVESPRLLTPRTVRFRSWDDRPGKRSFIRMLSPAKDAGTGFLLLHPNLWMYVPRVERTMRIPPSMMLQSWMGSDFTNDDLVRSSSVLDDYEQRLLGVDASVEGAPGLRAYVLEYIPHEDAPVVWGKIVSWVEVEHSSPLRSDFYDEDGQLIRTLRYTDLREVAGRHFPHHWEVRPLDKEGHRTVVEVSEITFDEDFDESIFTTRNLKRKD